MSRVITAATETESQADQARPIVFVELDWGGAVGVERLYSGVGTKQWNGYSWTGVGSMGGLSPLEEGSEFRSYGIELSLSGIVGEHISGALTTNIQGRPVRLYFGFLDDDYQVVADPVGPFEYDMDVIDVELGDTASAVLTAHNRARKWGQANVRRYTDQDQQNKYPGDRGFEFVARAAELEIIWPAAGGASSAVSAPPSAASKVDTNSDGGDYGDGGP